MREWMKLLVVVSAGAALTGCEPQRTAPTQPSGPVVHESVLAKAGLRYYWNIQVALDPGERITKLHRLDENLYCQTSQNRIIALDAQVGVPKWSVEVGRPDETIFRPSHADDVQVPFKPAGIEEMMHPERAKKIEPYDAVFINTVHYVLVLNRTTGEVVRRIDLGFAATSGGCSDGELFYIAAADGNYHAFSMREGVDLWALSTEGAITAPLECLASSIYVGSHDRHLHCARASRIRKQLWQQEMTGPVSAPFHVDTRGCFVPCEDGRVYAFDAISGVALWDPFVCEGPLRAAIQVSKTTVFQYASRDKFYAINLVNGKVRWTNPLVRLVLACMEGNAYLLDARHNLTVVDESLGEQKASLAMTGFAVFLPNTTAPGIYAATAAGKVYCIRPVSAGYLTVDMLHPGGEKPKVKPPPKGPAPKVPTPSTRPKPPTPKPPTPKPPTPKPKPGPTPAEPKPDEPTFE